MSKTSEIGSSLQKLDLNKSFPRKKAYLGQLESLGSLAAGGFLLWQGAQVKNVIRLPLIAGGTIMLLRGITRRSLVYQMLGVYWSGKDGAVRVERTATIERSPEELYSFWRDFSNLPQFMQHLDAVTVLEDAPKRSKWTAKAPAGVTVE